MEGSFEQLAELARLLAERRASIDGEVSRRNNNPHFCQHYLRDPIKNDFFLFALPFLLAMMGCSVLLAGMTRYLFRNKDEEPTETAFPESPLLVGLWLLICVLLIVHLTNAVKAREQFVSNIMYAKEKLRDLQDARFAFLRCKLCLLSTHAALAKATAYMMRVAIAGEQEARQRFLLDAPESDGGESDSTVDSENDGETEDGQPRPRTRAARHARILRTARENAARCLEEVRSAENRMEASRLFLDNTLHSARELEHWLPEDDRKLLTLNVS